MLSASAIPISLPGFLNSLWEWATAAQSERKTGERGTSRAINRRAGDLRGVRLQTQACEGHAPQCMSFFHGVRPPPPSGGSTLAGGLGLRPTACSVERTKGRHRAKSGLVTTTIGVLGSVMPEG